MTNDTARRLRHALNELIDATVALGPDTARDVIAAWLDEADPDAGTFNDQLASGIADAIRRAAEIAEGKPRAIIVADAAAGWQATFCWEETTDPLSGDFRAAIEGAVNRIIDGTGQ